MYEMFRKAELVRTWTESYTEKLAVVQTIVQRPMKERMGDFKDRKRKFPLPNLRYYTGNCLEG
jgi:hypothetical protein